MSLLCWETYISGAHFPLAQTRLCLFAPFHGPSLQVVSISYHIHTLLTTRKMEAACASGSVVSTDQPAWHTTENIIILLLTTVKSPELIKGIGWEGMDYVSGLG